MQFSGCRTLIVWAWRKSLVSPYYRLISCCAPLHPSQDLSMYGGTKKEAGGRWDASGGIILQS
eukprot:705543-Rhodomonas_salina.4